MNDSTDLTDPTDTAPDTPKKLIGKVASGFLIFFGILLPCFTFGFELVTRACADVLFDPMPTLFHTALVACVPVVNALLLVALWRKKKDWMPAIGWVSGFAVGVSAYYALLFLPVLPFAAIGILFFGFGLLPMSPMASFICGIVLRRKIRALAVGPKAPGLWYGVLLAVFALILIEAPKTITEIGLQMAVSEKNETRNEGIRMLRRFGSRKMLLGSCYAQRGRGMDPLGFIVSQVGEHVSTTDAREVYYRVTGEPFNAVKPPRRVHGRGFWSDFDPDVAGDEVSGRIRDLDAQESRMDVSADPDASLWYGEWTLVFKNDSFRQQEARALVALPAGGVVSRLTLWIDGEEREAAFGGRGQVKEAYRKVVSRRRDPVLVTTAGEDRVLVQCFPVPPDGGTMKIRMGITAPLSLTELDHGILQMPYFVERNFNIPEEMHHSLWVEADRALTPLGEQAGLTSDQSDDDVYAVRGSMQAAVLDGPLALRAERPGDLRVAWTKDPHEQNYQIVQRLELRPVEGPKRIVVVIDGSRKMGPFANDVADQLAHLPDGIEFSVLLASDEVQELSPMTVSTPESRAVLSDALRETIFVGGCDNVPALAQAWDRASAGGDGAVLWLHATQPIELQATETLRQRWERRPQGPRVYDLQFGPGPNRIARDLGDTQKLKPLAHAGNPLDVLHDQLQLWGGEQQAVVAVRTRVPSAVSDGKETSAHLARLWAADEVDTLLSSPNVADRDRDRALKLATTYQLVTPVSGAVVLETAQQYQEAGLEPVSSSTVPTIPEPETWMMLILVVCVMGGLLVRGRLRAKRSVC